MNFRANDPEGQARLAAFTQALTKLGWIEGSNLHTDIRWAADDPNLARQYADELVALKPDVLLASASQSVEALQRATRSAPIVFSNVIDRSVQASSTVCRDRGATPPDFPHSNTVSAGSGLNCFKSLRLTSLAWP